MTHPHPKLGLRCFNFQCWYKGDIGIQNNFVFERDGAYSYILPHRTWCGSSGKEILTSRSWACAPVDVDWAILGFGWRRGYGLFWACFLLVLLVQSQLWRGCSHGSLLVLLSLRDEISLPELRCAATSQDEDEQLRTEPCLFLTHNWLVPSWTAAWRTVCFAISTCTALFSCGTTKPQMSPCHADAFRVRMAACHWVDWFCCSVGQCIQGKPKTNVDSTFSIKMKFSLVNLYRCQQM